MITLQHIRRIIVASLLLAPAPLAWGQLGDSSAAIPTDIRPTDVVQWQAVGGETSPDGSVSIDLRLSTTQDFSIYEDKLKFSGPAGFVVSKIDAPQTTSILDPISKKQVRVYSGGEFKIHLQGLERHLGSEFPLSVHFIACTNRICLFPHTELLRVPVFASTKPATLPVPANADAAIVAPSKSGSWESGIAKDIAAGNLGFGWMLLFIFLGGVLTNLTPCVYPMIPITMRVLARQGHAPMLSASIYALGIVLTYTSLGLVAASTGTMFGSLMASTTFNVVFAGFMLFLGLGMLGYGNYAAAQAIGNRLGAGKPSLKNTLLLGIGAGLVASPCTGPILAALLAYTAKSGDVRQGSVLLFTYSFGFALPYVFLGGAAAKITQAKVAPIFQLITKVFFASVMFALALYYLRIPAYKILKPFADLYWDIFLASGAAGLVVAIIMLRSATMQNNKNLLLVPTCLLGISIFAGWQNFTTGTSDPNGAKVEWIRSEAEGFALAKATGKPILIDAWAEWCEACKKMDVTTFVHAEVVEQLSKNWVVIKLDLTETTEENDAITARLGIASLPTLTLVPASGDLQQKKSIAGYVDHTELLQHLHEFRGEK